MIQNRDACNILIECEVCAGKQFVGAPEIHEILAQSEIVKTKEFDKVSLSRAMMVIALDRKPLRPGRLEAGLLLVVLQSLVPQPLEHPSPAYHKVTKLPL